MIAVDQTVISAQGASSPGTAVYPSVRALAKELGICTSRAYTGLRDGVIPCIRLGRKFIIPRAAVAEWLRNAGKVVTDRNVERPYTHTDKIVGVIPEAVHDGADEQ